MAGMKKGPHHDEPSVERPRKTLAAGQKVRTRQRISD
jgi:hypothetical protein